MSDYALTIEQVKALAAKGGKLWERGSMRRMYFDCNCLGIEYKWDSRRWGVIAGGTFRGKELTKSEVAGYRCAKSYIDLRTGEPHSSDIYLLQELQALLAEVAPAEEQEPEQEQEQEQAEQEQEQETPCAVIAPAPIEAHDAEIYGLTYRVPACSYPATPPF